MTAENINFYLENTYHIQNLLEMNIDVKGLGKLKTNMVKDKLGKVKASFEKKDYSTASKLLNFVPTADLKSINKMASQNINGFEGRRKQLLSILKKNKTIKPQFQEAIASALAIPPDISKSKKAAKEMSEREYGVADFLDDVVDFVFLTVLITYIGSLLVTGGATLILLPFFISAVISLAILKFFTLLLVALTRAGGN